MKKHLLILLAMIIAASLCAAPAMAGDVQIVKSFSGFDYPPVIFGGKLYFQADDGTNGMELWVTDGTAGGTVMLKDIDPVGSSQASGFTVFNNKLYFMANDGTNGYELWVTDGTAGGTLMLKDINPAGDSNPNYFTVFNNKLYFVATDGTNGNELWVTDGTAVGTVMLKDISPVGDSSSFGFTVFNNKLYFMANDGTNGKELWVTDGTAGGTLMLKDINPGAGVSFPRYFTIFNNKLYFGARDGTNGHELWVTDGTAGGTLMLKDINPGAGDSAVRDFTVFNNKLYFQADDGTNGVELWVTDGTAGGTLMVKDIYPAAGLSSSPSGFTVFNNKLYFQADDGSGNELWVSDGTAGGTLMLKDINPTGVSDPSDFTVFNNKLYFGADDGTNGYELWVTDGTAGGTLMFKNIDPAGGSYLTFMTVLNNKLYFRTNGGGGYALQVFDPVPVAPSALTATGASTTQINLAWTDNSSDETGFRIFRNGVELTPPPKAAINAITFSDTGLTCGTTYNYEVKAMNADGDSTAATASGSTSGCPGAPTAPSALTATAASQTQINLSWTDNSSDEIGFKIYRGATLVTTTAANAITFSDTGLTCGTAYNYEVKANNAVGDSSATTASSTTQACTPPVTASVTLTGISSITGSTVLATGNATGTGIGERGFYWWIPPTAATHFGGSESGLIPEGYGAGSFSLTVTGLKPGNSYHLKAYVKVGGQIITSDEQLFTTATTGATGKSAPTVLTDTVNFTVSGSSITVSGEITDIGSSAVNVYGFVYAPHTAPFTGDDMPKTGDRAYAMWDQTPLYQGLKFTGTVKNIPPGKWYLRAYAHNENPDSDAAQTASLNYGEDISFTIACTPETCIPGDVNGDGKVDLADAMLVLRILAGIPVGNVNLNADVNGDGKIGLEELGYILQKTAGLR